MEGTFIVNELTGKAKHRREKKILEFDGAVPTHLTNTFSCVALLAAAAAAASFWLVSPSHMMRKIETTSHARMDGTRKTF